MNNISWKIICFYLLIIITTSGCGVILFATVKNDLKKQREIRERNEDKLKADSEENNYWGSVIESNTYEKYQEYIDKYPYGKYVTDSRKSIDKILWERTCQSNTIDAYRDYLERTHYGGFTKEAKDSIDEKEWLLTSNLNSYQSYKDFIIVHPESKHIGHTLEKMWIYISKENTIKSYQDYFSYCPYKKYPEQAIKQYWILIKNENTIEYYHTFLSKYPSISKVGISVLRPNNSNYNQISAVIPYSLFIDDYTVISSLKDLYENNGNNKSGYAVIELAKIGQNTYEAIPGILNLFPIIIETYKDKFEEAHCLTNDYRVNRRLLKDSDPLIKELILLLQNEYREFFLLVGSYGIISEYTCLSSPLGKETGKSIYGNAGIEYKIEAGAFVLQSVTGKGYGNDKSKWQQWGSDNKESIISKIVFDRTGIDLLDERIHKEVYSNILISLLRDWNSGVRWTAAMILGEMKDSFAVDPLIVALNDQNDYVRKYSVLALGQIGGPKAKTAIKGLLNDKNEMVRQSAQSIFQK